MAVGSGLLLLLVPGCPGADRHPQPPPVWPKRTDADVLNTISANRERFSRPLYAPLVSVSASLRDERGGKHQLDLRGRLVVQPPHNIWMRLDHALDPNQMELGSNDAEYWMIVRPDSSTMWWGRYEHLGKPCAETIAIEPTRVADALGLAALTPGFRRRITEPNYDRLIYHDDDSGADAHQMRQASLIPNDDKRFDSLSPRGSGDREYLIDRREPFMIRSAQYRNARGEAELMIALNDYRPVEGGPMLAREIEMRWPRRDSWMKLRIESVHVEEKISPRTFIRPTETPPGIRRMIQVDADCDAVRIPAP